MSRAVEPVRTHDVSRYDRARMPERALRSIRPPWTLWAYILWDLWRLIMLTAAVLVTVIAFAAAVKPLADGKLGPIDTLRFMLLAMPPMLQYALPFAACFGATLAYHRLTADNETIACHAGGISHRTIIAPAFITGVVLTGVLLVLSNQLIPEFLRRMADLVSQDAAKFITHNINSGEAVKLGGDRFLYADQVVPQEPDPTSGAFGKMWLGGLLLVKVDKSGQVDEQFSAQEATIWLRRVDSAPPEAGMVKTGPMTEVLIRARNFVLQKRDKRAQAGESIQPIYIPNSFADDPKFLSGAELRRLAQHPERIDGIERRRRDLALTMAQQDAVEAVRTALRTHGRVDFIEGDGARITLHAGDIRPRRTLVAAEARERGTPARDPSRLQVFPKTAGQPIRVERTFPDGRVQSQRANSAEIRLPRASSAMLGGMNMIAGGPLGAAAGGGPRIVMNLDMLAVSAQELDEDGEIIAPAISLDGSDDVIPPPAPGVIREWSLTDLALADDPAAMHLSTTTLDIIGEAERRVTEREGLAIERAAIDAPLRSLKDRLADLLREAMSKQHERAAMSIACMVMVLIGAIMAMRLRDSLPLTIYLWAFFPALAAVISISAGQQLTHGNGLAGLPLLWGGVAALGAYALAEFVKLSRH